MFEIWEPTWAEMRRAVRWSKANYEICGDYPTIRFGAKIFLDALYIIKLEDMNRKLRGLLIAQFSDPRSANAVINNELVLDTTPEEYVDQLLRGDLMEGER